MSESYVCCFTGHRHIHGVDMQELSGVFDNVIDRLVAGGVDTFISGGAIGFDIYAALKIIERKREYPRIRLHLYLPCRDQTQRWSGSDREAYGYMLENADKVIYTSEKYTRECMLYRDRRMVDDSDFCVAFCQRAFGGTAYTLNYARSKDIRIVNLATMLREENK